MAWVGGGVTEQGPFGRRRVERNHPADDEGPCLVTTPTDQPVSSSSTGRKRFSESDAYNPEGAWDVIEASEEWREAAS